MVCMLYKPTDLYSFVTMRKETSPDMMDKLHHNPIQHWQNVWSSETILDINLTALGEGAFEIVNQPGTFQIYGFQLPDPTMLVT